MPNSFVSGAAYGGTAREYMQGSGDPSVEWDTRGNAYYACLQFKRGSGVTEDPDQSSGIYVYRSTATNGASWNFTARPAAEHDDVAGAGDFLLDKPLITVDDGMHSPFRDRVYVTWTTFAADGTAYINEASSADYGEHFSAPVVVSTDSSLCAKPATATHPGGRCDSNQFSDPFTAPDGTLYVVWANFNNAVSGGGDNHSQVLLAKSTDGGATFSAPVKAGDFNDLPDCATYQGGADAFSACVPEKGATAASIFRAADYPYGAVDPRQPDTIAVTYGSYINRNSEGSKRLHARRTQRHHRAEPVHRRQDRGRLPQRDRPFGLHRRREHVHRRQPGRAHPPRGREHSRPANLRPVLSGHEVHAGRHLGRWLL